MKNIMIVDDSRSVRLLVSKCLQQLGFAVLEAGDGRQALDQLQGMTAIDLVITDINMPVMDGLELIRAIREDAVHKFTPVVFLTTENDAGRKAEARAAGATGWIEKPFQPDKIVTTVQRVLT